MTTGFVFSGAGAVAGAVKALEADESAVGVLAVATPMTGVPGSDALNVNTLGAAALPAVVTAGVVLAVVVLEGAFWPAAFLAAFCATASRALSASMKRPDTSSSFCAVMAQGAPPGPTAVSYTHLTLPTKRIV